MDRFDPNSETLFPLGIRERCVTRAAQGNRGTRRVRSTELRADHLADKPNRLSETAHSNTSPTEPSPRGAFGEEQIRDRLATHGKDFDDLAAEDYEAFLDRRAVLIHSAFTRLTNGAGWPA